VGKTASVAVGALVLGAYVLPGHAQAIATAAVVLAWALNARGITKTAVGATVIAIVVTAALAGIVIAAAAGDGEAPPALRVVQDSTPAMAVLLAAASAFFAFAGYARIATLGEEVRSPARTIPRAILVALGVVVALYLGVAWALATFGAMLAVMAGAGRAAMAVARERDLPAMLEVQGRSGAPRRAELVVAILAVTLVWFSDANLLLVSVMTVLTYYAIANLSTIRQRHAGRTAGLRVPVVVSGFGLLASLTLAEVSLPTGACVGDRQVGTEVAGRLVGNAQIARIPDRGAAPTGRE